MSVPLAGAVDADVHCAPRSIADLRPYLDEYWCAYVDNGGVALSPHQGGAYPPVAGPAPARDVAELSERLLDPTGVRLAILNCTTSFDCNRNPYYEAALTRAVNDWLRDEWLDRDSRLRASMVVPTLDTEAAVAEIERVGDDPRFVQVLLPIRADSPWGNKRHWPVLEAAAERGLVVGLHAWGRTGNAPTATGFTHSYLEDYLFNAQLIVQGQVTSLVSEGVFQRLPQLRVSLLECGFAWLPTLLWRFDKDWKGVWREVPWLSEKPSVVVRRHFRATTEPAHLPADPQRMGEALDMADAGKLLMFASDHPHEHGPGGQRLLGALDDSEREAVLAGNAINFYSL